MDYRIERAYHGWTLKRYLFEKLALSRAQVTALKKNESGILLNGLRVTVRAVLLGGDLLQLALEDTDSSPELLPYDFPLDILYEDDWIVLVNKPVNMPTHPSLGHFQDTLANALAAYYEKKGRPFVFRAVNRLDRDTTGVVLVAKSKNGAATLSRQIMARTVKKEYLALLEGALIPDSGEIVKNIVRVKESLILRRTDEVEGESAHTVFQVVERKNGLTLVRAMPLTGRTHQLRVHFSSIGHPIFADSLYGRASEKLFGQALHAESLSFDHPQSGQRMQIRAPLPEAFYQLLKENGFETI